MTTKTESLAAQILNRVGTLKSGTLRFWGVWFGRPYDNWHRVVGVSATSECLRLVFDAGEVLQVWEPRQSHADESFVIHGAARVRWEWFSYGLTRAPENLRFQDFTREGTAISSTTNADALALHDQSAAYPAVEIL